MDKWRGIIGIILVWCAFVSPFVWYYFRTKKKQREAVELEKKKQMEAAELKRQQQAAAERERVRQEQLQMEEEEQKAKWRQKFEEESRARQAKLDAAYAAYDETMASLEVFPIAVSDTKAEKLSGTIVNDLTYSTITKKSSWNKLCDFVVVDTETTGLNYRSHEIIEITAIRFRNFSPVAIFSTLLRPNKSIPEEATAVNHITDDMVLDKPSFQQIAASFLEFIGSDNLVGHNLPFDLKFIVHYGADVTQVKRKYFDTLALAQKTIKKARMKWDKELECYVESETSTGITDYKLDTIRSYLGIVTRDSHRAEADAMATGILFEKLAKARMGISTI